MTREEFLAYCEQTYGTQPDHPFPGDFVTSALRHGDSRKLYALLMHLPLSKFGQSPDVFADVVNFKIPTELFGSFDAQDGVYPAYHMNKRHWVSVILQDAPEDIILLLTDASYAATRTVRKRR